MNTLPARRHVIDMCQTLSRLGHFSGTGGNIALRIDEELIAVTPSGRDYLTMAADDVCVLRLSDLHQVEGHCPPSVETGLHAQVLRARPDVKASVHTHQPVASACALLGHPLQVPEGPLRRSLGSRVPVAGYAPSGSRWLSSKVARQIRPDINAYLMLNHGALCCGATAWAAMQAVDDLETLAKEVLLQRAMARGVREPAMQPVLRRLSHLLTA